MCIVTIELSVSTSVLSIGRYHKELKFEKSTSEALYSVIKIINESGKKKYMTIANFLENSKTLFTSKMKVVWCKLALNLHEFHVFLHGKLRMDINNGWCGGYKLKKKMSNDNIVIV